METIVLIPAFDPDEKMVKLCQSLKEKGCQIVIINDGSPSSFQPVFHACSAYALVLTHLQNKGKGAALKTGLTMLKREKRNAYVVVSADADGQHGVDDILKCAKVAESYPGSLVIGTRHFDDPSVPFRSQFGNKITSAVFALITGKKIQDTQSGLRAFTNDLVPDFLNVHGDRYEYETNVLLDVVEKKIPVEEVPIETIYLEGNRSSHFHVVRDSLLISSRLIKFALSSFSSFLIDYSFFLLFNPLLKNITAANVTARLISASWNYIINRNVVFHHEGSTARSLGQYASLAVVILILNTLILLFLTDILHLHAWIAKIITELILFLFSWTIQHNFIFTSSRKAG